MSNGTRRRLRLVAAVLLALVAAAIPAAEALHDHPHSDAECPVCEASPAPDGVRRDSAALPDRRDTASPGLAEADAKVPRPPVPRSHGARAPPA